MAKRDIKNTVDIDVDVENKKMKLALVRDKPMDDDYYVILELNTNCHVKITYENGDPVFYKVVAKNNVKTDNL